VPATVLLGVTLGASGSAMADAPDSWQTPTHVSATYTLLVLGAIPLGLFLLITLLVYLPSMRHRSSDGQGEGWRGEAAWFGGPRGGLEAADRNAPPAVTSGRTPAGDQGTQDQPGGTSGRW
jgi:hypothetical protein